jgi:N-acetylglucosamine-6-phosphate deacetylase
MLKENEMHFTVEGIHYSTGKQVTIVIADGLIESVTDTEASGNPDSNLYVAPGLIDNQINGYAGVNFSGDSLSVSSVTDAAGAIWKEGVTSFLPTLITNSHENLIKNFTILDEALSKDKLLSDSIPGFHLEGPYISPGEGYRGCHPVKYIRKPSVKEFAEYQKAAGGRIIQVTIAPELEGAMELIQFCISNKIAVAIGHTSASATQIREAVDKGATISTHLGNGCANFIHRHNNPIWVQLDEDRLTPSVIADGHHLLPEEVRVFYKVKGPDNMIIASDIMYLAGMAPGKYIFMESEVVLTEDGMLLNTELKCLAGASFPLKTGVGNMIRFTGCTLTQAVDMASRNVACINNLEDRGTLSPGKRADLILFERKGNELQIRKTYLSGKLVYGE